MARMAAALQSRIEAVRSFNRFYTRKIGVLEEGLLSSAFSLTEVRVLYELAHAAATEMHASALAATVGIDSGYLSRILQSLRRRGLVRRKLTPDDLRRSSLSLSARGRKELSKLEIRARAQVDAMLRPLNAAEQRRLIDAMREVERLLDRRQPPGAPLILRSPEPGDIGWVVHRHGALYAHEYGYDARFEALVATIAGEFVQTFDPRRERCWIAERGGQIVGSVFLVRKSATVAKLRLLLVEPSARGAGVGTRLVDECVRFARHCGYRRLVLWTQSELKAARAIYRRSGFRLVDRHPHRSFGRNLVAETWQMAL